jgi:hypothetical protein
LGNDLTVECSDNLHDCESVTPTFDRSTAEAFFLFYNLCLASEPKNITTAFNHPIGGGWSFDNLAVLIVFLVRRRHKFGAAWADFNLGSLGFYLFTIRPPMDWMSGESGLDH